MAEVSEVPNNWRRARVLNKNVSTALFHEVQDFSRQAVDLLRRRTKVLAEIWRFSTHFSDKVLKNRRC